MAIDFKGPHINRLTLCDMSLWLGHLTKSYQNIPLIVYTWDGSRVHAEPGFFVDNILGSMQSCTQQFYWFPFQNKDQVCSILILVFTLYHKSFSNLIRSYALPCFIGTIFRNSLSKTFQIYMPALADIHIIYIYINILYRYLNFQTCGL